MFALLGIFLILAGCWFFSAHRGAISLRTVLSGLLLQAMLCLFILKIPLGEMIFDYLGKGVNSLTNFAGEGGRFVFADLYDNSFVFFFRVTASIIFISALVSVLSYLKILQPILGGISFVLQKAMGVSGAEALVNTGSALLGQIGSALPIKNSLSKLGDSQLFCIMAGGMSTISMSLLSVYVGMGIPAKYLLAANLMGIPSGLVIAKMLYPSTKSEILQPLPKSEEKTAQNFMDALVQGAKDGLDISLIILGVMIAIISLIAMLNALLGLVGLSVSQILGYVFYPVALLMGTPIEECTQVGALLGKKIAINEFVAFSDLAKASLSQKSSIIAAFSLCGFANFGSVAMQIGAFGQMIPERRARLSSMGLKAMIAGALASCLSACWAALFS